MSSAKSHSFFCFTHAGLRAAACLAVMTCLQVHAGDLKEKCDSYFAEMFENFSAVSKNPTAKKTSLAAIDRYFVTVLKNNQTFQSLIKTNSKGIIISEVIRGKTPNRAYRNIADQQWFRYIARNTRAYQGFLEEEGRYYLFWAEPVIITANSGKKKFNGSLAVKIDLWDSFHHLAKTSDQPFLVRMNGKSLYSNRWSPEFTPTEKPLDIPGIDRISVLFEDGGENAGFSPGDSIQSGPIVTEDIASVDSGTESAKEPIFTFNTENYLYIIIAVVVLIFILLVALTRLLIWVKHKRLENRIDREDVL